MGPDGYRRFTLFGSRVILSSFHHLIQAALPFLQELVIKSPVLPGK
jgi:hypothetical protein